jgi:hypothetical protein
VALDLRRGVELWWCTKYGKITTTARKSRTLFRPEELTYVTVDARAELLDPTIRRKLMERQL